MTLCSNYAILKKTYAVGNVFLECCLPRFFVRFLPLLTGKRMCTEDQHNEKIELLKDLVEGRPPLDDHIAISSVKPWYVDYRDRKHIFIWLPTTQTLSFEEFGNGPVQAQVWINIGMPAGIKMLAPNSSSLIDVYIRCTDEELP